jgi:hypothetical protein
LNWLFVTPFYSLPLWSAGIPAGIFASIMSWYKVGFLCL